VTTSRGQEAWNPWSYRSSVGVSGGKVDLVGFDVEATDGDIGKVDEATYDAGSSYVVVDTGPWILGHKVMLPAGAVNRVDRSARKVYVPLTKEEIKNAPEFDKSTYTNREYHDRLAEYYRRFRY